MSRQSLEVKIQVRLLLTVSPTAQHWTINQQSMPSRVAWMWVPPNTSTLIILQVIPHICPKSPPKHVSSHLGCTHLIASTYFQLNSFWDTSGTHRILKHWSPKIEKCNHHSSRCSSYMMPTIQMFEDIQMSKGPYFSLFNLAFQGHLKDTATLHLFIFLSWPPPPSIPSLHSSFPPPLRSINLNVSIVAGIITFGFSI